MALTMHEKQALTKQLALKYKRARKKEKGQILSLAVVVSPGEGHLVSPGYGRLESPPKIT